jgi:hypothetical protein
MRNDIARLRVVTKFITNRNIMTKMSFNEYIKKRGLSVTPLKK